VNLREIALKFVARRDRVAGISHTAGSVYGVIRVNPLDVIAHMHVDFSRIVPLDSPERGALMRAEIGVHSDDNELRCL